MSGDVEQLSQPRLQTATRRSASNMHSPCGILLGAVSNRRASWSLRGGNIASSVRAQQSDKFQRVKRQHEQKIV
jgi:hypothetical protein